MNPLRSSSVPVTVSDFIFRPSSPGAQQTQTQSCWPSRRDGCGYREATGNDGRCAAKAHTPFREAPSLKAWGKGGVLKTPVSAGNSSGENEALPWMLR